MNFTVELFIKYCAKPNIHDPQKIMKIMLSFSWKYTQKRVGIRYNQELLRKSSDPRHSSLQQSSHFVVKTVEFLETLVSCF